MAERVVSKPCPMVGGEGPESYSKASYAQRAGIHASKDLIREAISRKLDLQHPCFDLTASTALCIADYGCSTGPNTFVSVQNVIEAVELRLEREGKAKQDIEFQVLFNDHVNNDFNTLFRTLPPNRRYFAAAAPGSFHNPVFPSRRVHIGHVSYALHWLSRVPEEVVDRNRESIHCTGLAEEVVDAYAAQFRRDAEAFLDARARELVPGGLMAIVAVSQPPGLVTSETRNGMVLDILGHCLFDMAKEGLIDEKKMESFNLPTYFAQISELKKVMEDNKNFRLEFMEDLGHPMEVSSVDVRALASMYRAICEGLVREHFGDEIIGELFERLLKKLETRLHDLKEVRCETHAFFLLSRIN